MEFTGVTIDEALKKASDTLKLTSDNIEFEIVTLGSKGFFGVGKKPAAIMVKLRNAKIVLPESDKQNSKKSRRSKPERGERPKQQDRPKQKDRPKRGERPKQQDRPEKRRDDRRPERARRDEPEFIIDEAAHADHIKKIGDFTTYIVKRIDEDISADVELKENRIVVTLETENTGKIIGKGGRVINSVEYLAMKYARILFDTRVKVVVQVNGERKSRS